jgi:dTDP-4-dehydrorhamnose 3,5-epimerase
VTDIGTQIPGVEWGHVEAHADERGAFRELWRASKSTGRFVQANLSLSHIGVLRGLHFHKRQRDFWVVADGDVFVALVDLRNQQTGELPRPVTRLLTTNDTVTIPERVAHGFLALRQTSLLYLVTNEYDGSDEHGLAWDDPEIAVPWPRVETPDGLPILSDRDRRNPSYRELRPTVQGAKRA